MSRHIFQLFNVFTVLFDTGVQTVSYPLYSNTYILHYLILLLQQK